MKHSTVLRRLRGFRSSERGFTLTEIAIAIALMAILSAIAVPVFLSQNKTTVDNQLRTELQVIGQAARDLSLQHPTTNAIRFQSVGDVSGKLWVDLNEDWVADANEPARMMEKRKGNNIAVVSEVRGTFSVYGWNEAGRHYVSQDSAALWDKSAGGFVDGLHMSPASGM